MWSNFQHEPNQIFEQKIVFTFPQLRTIRLINQLILDTIINGQKLKSGRGVLTEFYRFLSDNHLPLAFRSEV